MVWKKEKYRRLTCTQKVNPMLNPAKKKNCRTLTLTQKGKPKRSALPFLRCVCMCISQPFEVLGDPRNSEVSKLDEVLFCNNKACILRVTRIYCIWKAWIKMAKWRTKESPCLQIKAMEYHTEITNQEEYQRDNTHQEKYIYSNTLYIYLHIYAH